MRITSSATTKAGAPVSKTVTLKPYHPGHGPAHPGRLRQLRGHRRDRLRRPGHAARELTQTVGGVPGFTIQTLPDDDGYVDVPQAGQDLSILNP